MACGSIDWVDRARFLPDAARVLASGGWLFSLDFGGYIQALRRH